MISKNEIDLNGFVGFCKVISMKQERFNQDRKKRVILHLTTGDRINTTRKHKTGV